MNILGQVKEKVISWAEVYLDLFKLTFIQRTSSILSYLMFAMIGMFIAFCILLFIGFGLKEVFIGLGLSGMVSLLLVIAFYFLLLGLLVALRKSIIRFFSGNIIRAMTDGDEDEDPSAVE